MSDQLQVKEDATRQITVSTAQWIAALLGPDMNIRASRFMGKQENGKPISKRTTNSTTSGYSLHLRKLLLRTTMPQSFYMVNLPF